MVLLHLGARVRELRCAMPAASLLSLKDLLEIELMMPKNTEIVCQMSHRATRHNLPRQWLYGSINCCRLQPYSNWLSTWTEFPLPGFRKP